MLYRVEFQYNLIKEDELSKNPMLYRLEFQNNVMTDDDDDDTHELTLCDEHPTR